MVPEFPKYHESNLIVVAARPAMGRLRYLCALANDRAKSHHVLINSFAFGEKHLRVRRNLSSVNITIDDTPSPTIEELGCIIRNAVKKHNIKTVVIDYLNLLSGSNPDNWLNDTYIILLNKDNRLVPDDPYRFLIEQVPIGKQSNKTEAT